ncbi:MAG: AAA family ATPase [Calditrichae bacterium]|nr:AAA family ATPase [Calditrichota bacterium]MCB9059755.1 AAA family ATPase [Calditrichia bacterium]
MFKPIANPYIVGNPIKTAEMFFGRQDDFDFIKRKLQAGDKSYIIVLCGERRSGKTSILFQILSGRLGDDFVPILVDMQTMAGLKNEREFFEKFAQETLKYINQKIDINDFFKSQDSSFKAFAAFLEEIHKRNKGKHILFLIDEYELIEAKINEGSLNENFIPFLAGLLEGEQLISFIFTGSTKLEERKAKMWQILFAKSLFRNVSYLSRDDTLRLIQEPVKEYIEFDVVVLNIIYRLTSGQPFYTQVVCQNIVDYVNQKKQTNIQEEDLDIIVSEILENPLPQMIYFWNSQSDDRKLVLSLMAELLEEPNAWINAEQIISESKKRKFGLDLDVKSINMTLEGLFHSQHLGKSQVGYKFQMDLFRRWIKRDHAIWRVMKEVSSLGMASSIEKQVFNSSDSDPANNRKMFIYAFFTFLVVVSAGWYIFSSGEEKGKTIAEKPAEQVKEEIAQPDKKQENPIPAIENDAQKKLVEEKKEKPVETRSSSEESKKAEENKKKTVAQATPQPKETKPAAPKMDPAIVSNAESAKAQMNEQKSNAERLDAKNQATTIYRAALTKEQSADSLFDAALYPEAGASYNQAGALYARAIEEISKKANAEKNSAEQSQRNMLTAKNKLNMQQKKMPAFASGESAEEQGNRNFSSNNFAIAVNNYKTAQKDFEQALQQYETNKNSITTIINGYLDGIQNESIIQMKKYHGNFTKDLENDWQKYFKAVDGINVTRSVKMLDFDDQTAKASVDVQLSFAGSQNSPVNSWQFSLTKNSAGWIITGISEGN